MMRIERRKGTSLSPIPNEPRPALPTPRGCGGQWLLFRGDPSSLDAPDALPGLTQGLLHARMHACAERREKTEVAAVEMEEQEGRKRIEKKAERKTS